MTGDRDYDVIVIGAGHNSLVTAAMLARAGRRVLVLERRDRPGGVADTEEAFPGFHFDTGLYNLGALRPEIVRDLALERCGLELLRSDATVCVPVSGGPALQLSHDMGTSAESIRRFSPSDAEAYPAFGARMARLAEFLAALEATVVPNIHTPDLSEILGAAPLGPRLRALGGENIAALLRTLPIPVADLLDDTFESDVLKGALGAAGIAHLMHGPRAQGTGLLFLHHLIGSPVGAFRAVVRARGGAGALGRALAAAARAHGAEIRLGAEVARLDVRNGRVAGAVLTSGEEIRAPRVAAGIDAHRLFLRLIDPVELEPRFLRAAEHVRYRGSTARVNLALDGLPAFRVAVNGSLRGAISPYAALDDLERAYDDAKYGRLPARPYFEATVPTLADPGLAPAGKHVLSVQVSHVPYRLEGGWTDAQRRALGDRVMAMLAELAPDLPARALYRQVLAPPDLEARFGSAEGSLYHGEMTLDQLFFMRPVAGWGQYRTPIDGLYLCGASAHPGGGLSGQAGRNAAQVMLRARRAGSAEGTLRD